MKDKKDTKPENPTHCLWCLGWGELYESDIWGTCMQCKGTGKSSK